MIADSRLAGGRVVLLWLLVIVPALVLTTACAGTRLTPDAEEESASAEAEGTGEAQEADAPDSEPAEPPAEQLAEEPAEPPAEPVEDGEPIPPSEDAADLPGENPPREEQVLGRDDITKRPGYEFLARSLRHYERELGVEFYQNELGRYLPYSVAAWDSFSIADRAGDCLFDVQMLGVQNYRHLDGRRQVLIEMEITEAPCGLSYPNADIDVADRIATMEGTVVTPALLDRLDGGSRMCSDRRFLESILQVPFKLEITGDDTERSIARIAERVQNPLNYSFGDVVFFSPYPGEVTVGVYAGYGLIVYNTCFGARAHRMTSDRDYRFYRLFCGFAWTRYRLHERTFLEEYVGGPR